MSDDLGVPSQARNPAITHEFDCIDCGFHVYSFGITNQNQRCATCEWINSQSNESDKEKLRKWFAELDKRGAENEREK